VEHLVVTLRTGRETWLHVKIRRSLITSKDEEGWKTEDKG